MPGSPIHFGTSGWRGIIAEDFTFAHVRLAAAGIAHYLLTRSGRLSGTEPVVRIYCEAHSPADLERLSASAKTFALNP